MTRTYPQTVPELLELRDVPVVAINQESIFISVNAMFEETFGWSEQDLVGKSVGLIMPEHMRSAHAVGFARFLTTESSELMGRNLPLSVLYKDGRTEIADHYILGEKLPDGRWRFAAVIESPDKNA